MRCDLTFGSAVTVLSTLSLLGGAAQAQDMGDFVADGPTASRPADPLTNSVSSPAAALTNQTPDYFEATYPHLLRAPLPARIYKQGGVPPVIEPLEMSANPFGRLGTYLPGGAIDTTRNAFFLPLNSANGRACVTCHQPPSGMSISLRNIRGRFRNTGGTDPLFVPVDGANCPDAVPASFTSGAPYGSLKGKGLRSLRQAYSLLLNRGLIRIPMPWPPKGNSNPEFTLDLVRDAPGCNRSDDFGLKTGIASVYRRPQISAQMSFKTVRPKGTGPVLAGSVMWDAREPSLEQQAINATLGHAQALQAPTSAQVAQIVAFENSVYSAQLKDRLAGRLDQAGGKGGPVNLSGQTISPSFSPPITFNEYDAWIPGAAQRRSIANGQRIFNQRTLLIVDVAGVNSVPGSTFFGACSTCHNVDHAGADVLPNPQRDIGVGGTASASGGPSASGDLPVFRLTCRANAAPHPFLGRGPIETNDPGLALFTGRCADIGKFTVPQLRALAAREPYFHDGSAATLEAAVRFYEQRFQLSPPLSDQDRPDLVSFLSAL